MRYIGDFPTGATVRFLWNTNGADGASITRATDGTLRIYKDGGTTERSSASGITQTEDFDSNTGVHLVAIDLSDNTDAGFYAAGHEYSVVMNAMTIDGKTVNAIIAHFSIERDGGALALIKNATYGLSALKTLIDTVDDFVDTEVAAIKAQTDKLAFTGAGPYEVKADVVDWKGVAAPAMTGDAYARLGAPAGASIAADIAAVQAAMNLIAPLTDASDSVVLAAGTAIAGTYVNTQSDDDNRYTLAPVNPGGLDLTLVFQLGTGRAPVSVGINGYWNGSGQYCNVLAYDYDLGVWDQLTNSTTRMNHRTSETNYSFALNREHIKSDGEVSIRFVSPSTNTAHRLYLDRVLVASVAEVASGTGGTITYQGIWEYVTRTLTSDTGEDVDANAIAQAVRDITNESPAVGSLGEAVNNAIAAVAVLNAIAALNDVTALDVATAILTTPANKLLTDANGYVTANVTGSISVSGDVTLAALQPNYAPAKAGDEMALTSGVISSIRTGLSTLTAQQVWEYGTRTLTSLGSAVADIVSGVWAAATRTLTAFGFSVTASNVPTSDITAIKAKTDNLPTDPADQSLLIAAIGTPMQAGATINATVTDKTGFKLASDGLDSVAAPADLANDTAARATFVGMIRALFNRFYNRVDQTATQQTIRNDAGTIHSTKTVNDTGTTQTLGKSA